METRAPLTVLADLAWRTAYRTAFPLARLWWNVRRPHHEGTLVAIRVGAGLLMVRNSYRSTWNFPGGGVKRGETPEQAARRELSEEIGYHDAPELTPICVLVGLWEGRPGQVHIFELRLERLPPIRIDHREITDARLVAEGDLARMGLTRAVAAYLKGTHRAG